MHRSQTVTLELPSGETYQHHLDIDFTIVAKPYESSPEHVLDVKAYKIINVTEDGDIQWERKGSDTGPDPVMDVDDAYVFLSGTLKFDGCSNWHFDEQDHVAIHLCGPKHGKNIGTLFERIYELAMTMIPTAQFDTKE